MQLHSALLGIGVLFLVGLVADVLGRRTNIPRVTLLMLVWVLIGRSGLEMLPAELEYWYEFLAAAALTMVGSEARVLDWSNGVGHVWAEGERWQARSERELTAGESVRVRQVRELTLMVDPASGDGAGTDRGRKEGGN